LGVLLDGSRIERFTGHSVEQVTLLDEVIWR